MFFRNVFAKKQIRKFQFTPYYYDEKEVAAESGPRIKFRRLRQGTTVSKKSIRGMAMLALLLLACLVYFWNLVRQELQTFDMEDIKIEAVPSDF